MVKRLFSVAMGIALGLGATAQEREKTGRVEIGAEYSTELQTDFKRAKWVNLLRTDLSVGLAKGLSLSAATLSTAETDERPLIRDLQGFSNIEAENIALTLAVLSLDWTTKRTTLSAGIRNLNENYFATPLTSLFTQSSHGIFPTLSANFPIANYPVASMGIDFQWRLKKFSLDASLYNGLGHKDFTGRENLFRFCPESDGVFAALQLSHEAGYGSSHLGAALRSDDEQTRTALWTYTELRLADRTQLLAQYSLAPGAGVECRQHASLGVKQTVGKVEIGVAENFARFAEADDAARATRRIDEWTTELTARLPLTPRATLQPTVHLCRTGGTTNGVGLLRLTYRL